MSKVNNRHTRKRCKICAELTIKTPERHPWPRSGVFIVNSENIPQVFSTISVTDFEQANVSWVTEIK